ncbi:transcriptional repressor LexA [Streptomyces fulvoviolaceus]|uniref:hypothetical protein n=1 Tax=Streptomyces fulvoviolaceus TaxID=285535 RepID=UPI0021BFFF4E|nr:hypothetical protein [Streptomyces fulvoviolaceus]MCT9076542.1 hypothetical protein [Streptomyces fulvoviolaceus]
MISRTRSAKSILFGGQTREGLWATPDLASAESGEAPTVQEIGARAGAAKYCLVHYQVGQCEEKGAIVREPGKSRGLRLAW